jgi:hemerythrin superfamily protein
MGKVAPMDAITLLKNDHRTVEALFKRFEKLTDGSSAERKTVVDKIIEELSIHASIEEQLFYPTARRAVPDAEDDVLEGLEEHHIVKWTLSELVDMTPADERFKAKVTVLMESVRHHVKDEEEGMFPRIRKGMDADALARLGASLEEAKATAPTRPHPRVPDTPPGNRPRKPPAKKATKQATKKATKATKKASKATRATKQAVKATKRATKRTARKSTAKRSAARR